MAVLLVSMKKRGKNKWAVAGLAFLCVAVDLGATHGLLIWKAKAYQRGLLGPYAKRRGGCPGQGCNMIQ